MNKQIIIAVVVTLVIGGGLGFFAGTKYQSTQTPSFAGAGGNFANRTKGQPGVGMIRGGGTVGEVLSRDDKSLTVKLLTGGSKIVFFDTNTAVMKTSTSSIDSVVIGGQVIVTGSTNSDGSVIAKNIQVR